MQQPWQVDLESLIGASTVGLKYASETSRHRGVRVEAGELLGGWQPESRIYTVVAKREIATADLIATDAASHRAHADGGAMTVPLEPHSRADTSCISENIPNCQKSAVSMEQNERHH
ncbi:hypothetical protein EMCRGX_G003067 [Ephydatia muelleri]